MNQASLARRSRALAAMGLAPLWVRRDLPSARSALPIGVPHGEAHSPERTVRIAQLGWDALENEVAGCVACGLAASRTRTVFGNGAARPAWLVLGEAPGADEDLVGEPFVGQAGQLLDAMLTAVGLSRDRDVFVANVVRCRPPADRDPGSSELASCRPFLERQIDLLEPKVILVVGEVATAALLDGGTTASRRGRVHRVSIAGRERSLIATYHPAYLLRSPEEKARAWQDLCLAADTYRRMH